MKKRKITKEKEKGKINSKKWQESTYILVYLKSDRSSSAQKEVSPPLSCLCTAETSKAKEIKSEQECRTPERKCVSLARLWLAGWLAG